MYQVVKATSGADTAKAKELAAEYIRWLSAEVGRSGLDGGLALQSLSYGDGISQLLKEFVPPSGRMLLATNSTRAAGCVALRELEKGVCELRMLYVRPEYRGLGLSRALVQTAIDEACAIGYRTMYLETATFMQEAQGLYRSLGFREIEPYEDIPEELRAITICMALNLDDICYGGYFR